MKTNNAIGSSHVIDMATQAEEADFIGEDCAISGWGRTGKYQFRLQSDHSKIDKIKVLMAKCSFMKVESLQKLLFCNTFDLR